MKIHLRLQDLNKKVLLAHRHCHLTEEQITSYWPIKVLFMDLHLHLILSLKFLPNKNIMNLKITKKAFKKLKNSKIYWILNHQIMILAFPVPPQTDTETMKMKTISVAARMLTMINLNNKLFKRIWIHQMCYVGHKTN